MMPKRHSWLEFCLVVGMAFGSWMLASVWSLFQAYDPGAAGSLFGRAHLVGVLWSELAIGLILAVTLGLRGWRLRDFDITVNRAATGTGALLVLAALGIWWVTGIVSGLFSSGADEVIAVGTPALADPASFGLILLVSLVNPVYEETLACAYVIKSLEARLGTIAAVNVSTAIRMTYHLYQGPAAFLQFALLGLLFGYTYARTRSLWPLIVAHAALDFAALLEINSL